MYDILNAELLKIVFLILLIINAGTMFLYKVDKWKAVHGRYRISERTLLLAALLGGSIGALLGMYLFHHKTRKPLFYLGVPAILMLESMAVLLWKFQII